MCLAIPGRIIDLTDAGELTATGRVDFGGIRKRVSLAFVPEARLGDWVLVHAGVAITLIDAAAAAQLQDDLARLGTPG
jgi:hydrogenase expression/formation protein HypC